METVPPDDLAPDPCRANGARVVGDYRYLLWRTWDHSRPRLLWVLLNPSTADAGRDDNTVACCKRFSREWGCGGFEIVNLFALRSTDPAVLASHPDPIGPENDRFIAAAAAQAAGIVVAWGEKGVLRRRDRAVLALLVRHAAAPLLCLGTAGNGSPRHPLRLSGTTRPVPFSAPEHAGYMRYGACQTCGTSSTSPRP